MGKLIKKIAIENDVSEEVVEKSIEKIITSSMNRFANDKYTLWKPVFETEWWRVLRLALPLFL